MKNFITPRMVRPNPTYGEGGGYNFSACAPESIAISQIVRVRLLFPAEIGRVSHEPCPITEIQLSNKEWVLVAGTPEDIDRLITEASSESGSGWQPIETAPKNGGVFLAAHFFEGKRWFYDLVFWDGKDFREASGEERKTEFDYWQLLPNPPKGAQS